MTTNSAAGNGHEHAPRWNPVNEVLGWMSRRWSQSVRNLAQLWRQEAVRHVAFSAIATLLGALLLSRLMPHVPGWTEMVDEVCATVDDPVRRYLTTHTQALPITAATTYSIWKAIGFGSLLLGFFHNGPARFTWTVVGAATVIMVWVETPGPGRPIATGVAFLAWAALSVLALRGLRLPPLSFVHVDVHNEAPPPPEVEVRTEIHTPQHQQPQYLPYVLPYVPPSPN
jgi:hypothetical protein